MHLFFYSLFDLLFRRADIELPYLGGPIHLNNYDAILYDMSWHEAIGGPCAIGHIRGDKKGHLVDGLRIQTTEIQEVYLVTRYSIYKVEDGSWRQKAREHGPEFGQFDYRAARYGLFGPEEDLPTHPPDHLPGNLGGQP